MAVRGRGRRALCQEVSGWFFARTHACLHFYWLGLRLLSGSASIASRKTLTCVGSPSGPGADPAVIQVKCPLIVDSERIADDDPVERLYKRPESLDIVRRARICGDEVRTLVFLCSGSARNSLPCIQLSIAPNHRGGSAGLVPAWRRKLSLPGLIYRKSYAV